MSAKFRGVNFTVVILLAIVALFAGLYVYQHTPKVKKLDPADFQGTFLKNPRTVNQFSLIGTDGKKFDNSSLKGQWTIFFFGFTNCGYLCPTTMAELGKMYSILEKNGVKKLPKVVMISIDPERDSLEKLGHYVSTFNESFYGARGDEESIKSMTREMGIAYSKVINNEGNSPDNYDMQHSGALILFNPQGELNAFFTTPHKAELIAKDYMLLVS